jgi:hypothetical protein
MCDADLSLPSSGVNEVLPPVHLRFQEMVVQLPRDLLVLLLGFNYSERQRKVTREESFGFYGVLANCG